MTSGRALPFLGLGPSWLVCADALGGGSLVSLVPAVLRVRPKLAVSLQMGLGPSQPCKETPGLSGL